jgi:hypothetical protein
MLFAVYLDAYKLPTCMIDALYLQIAESKILRFVLMQS